MGAAPHATRPPEPRSIARAGRDHQAALGLKVGEGQIVTQPGYFCLAGDGISVGRDSASAVSLEYDAPFPFTGGAIEKVVVDVSGEHYVDHEARVIGWFMKD